MHHEDIKAAIRKKGVTPADIAKTLQVTDQTVSSVIRGVAKSARIAQAIARVCEKPVSELWPGKYDKVAATSRVLALLGAATHPPKSGAPVAKTTKASARKRKAAAPAAATRGEFIS